MTSHSSLRRVERVRQEPQRRKVQVSAVESLGPHFASITFSGETLDSFQSPGFDDHVKFMLPGEGDSDGEDMVRRDYTPRRFNRDRREVVIEFALHGHGPTSEWARMVKVGQSALIAGPRGSMIVPTDFDWHILAGDSSALPAIHRRLEELPATTRAIVVLDVPDPADRRPLSSAATLDLQWLPDSDTWLEALRRLKRPPGEGYVWCAGEASVMAQVREVVYGEWQHPREHAKVAAYWKRGAADYHDKDQ